MPLPSASEPPLGPWPAPPASPEERLERIRVPQERINAHVEYMCQAGILSGASAEAKEKALGVFYEQLVVVERRLGRIREELRLGWAAPGAAFEKEGRPC